MFAHSPRLGFVFLAQAAEKAALEAAFEETRHSKSCRCELDRRVVNQSPTSALSFYTILALLPASCGVLIHGLVDNLKAVPSLSQKPRRPCTGRTAGQGRADFVPLVLS